MNGGVESALPVPLVVLTWTAGPGVHAKTAVLKRQNENCIKMYDMVCVVLCVRGTYQHSSLCTSALAG